MDTKRTTDTIDGKDALPAGLRVRAATMDDLDAVCALYNACSMAEYGAIDITLADLQEAWGEPTVNLAEDTRLVFDHTGRLIAEADVFRQGKSRVWGYAAVRPDAQGRGIGTYLLRHIEARSRAWAAKVASGERVEMRQSLTTTNRGGRALLEAAGYVAVRRTWRMEIALDEASAPGDWPYGIQVRTLVAGRDEHAVYAAMQEAFADHWGHVPLSFEEYAHWHFAGDDYDPSLCFLAMDGEAIAGAALCHMRPEMGWVQNLGVRRAYRHTGIGMALLRQVFGAFCQRGQRTVGLEVDTQNLTGAVALYERVGMRPVREWVQYEKVLRPATHGADAGERSKA